jgi:hypothetical protein
MRFCDDPHCDGPPQGFTKCEACGEWSDEWDEEGSKHDAKRCGELEAKIAEDEEQLEANLVKLEREMP